MAINFCVASQLLSEVHISLFCHVYGPRLINNRHYLPKNKSTATDKRNQCYGAIFHFPLFFFLHKKDLECIGFFESAEIQMEPVKCGAWPAFPKDVFSLFSSQ